jgi:MGT family glycosyltransferase
MSRFLVVVPPLAGHVNPTIAVGDELRRRGHEVAWAGHPDLVAAMLPQGFRLFPAGGDLRPEQLARIRERWVNLRSFAALKVLWEDVLVPLGASMVEDVEAAVDAFSPDVLVVDQQALAGAVVARRRGLRWATTASTFSEFTRPYAGMPRIERWVREQLEAFQRRCGIGTEEARRGDLRFSDHVVIAFTTPELTGPLDAPCSPVFVGPAIGPRPAVGDFPWKWLDPRRGLVLASLGTHNAGAGVRFFRVLVEGVTPMARQVQVVLVAPPGAVGEVPGHVLVRPFVPQVELLPRVHAVVSHGGSNTVGEALAHCIPLVVAPIRDDQPIVAASVAACGAGIQVRFARVRPAELRAALSAVLHDPGYRCAARRIGAAFDAAGGARAAADHLEKLA